MIQYTWIIHSLTKETVSKVDDVIVSITWEKIGVDTEDYRKGSVKLNTIFTDEQLKTNNFIPFENLKKRDVINWIKSIGGA